MSESETEIKIDLKPVTEQVTETEEHVKENVKEETKIKKKKTPGVVYLSKVPKKMNVKIIRDYFSRFGDTDRIFLEPQEKKRKSQARTFSEGWIEFKNKKIAARVARDLNSTQVGGKRKNPWYHELWNLKYLKKFRWTHLNERKAYEQEARKQRLRQEVALAKKETNFYIQNVEKNEKKKRFDKKLLKTALNTEENNTAQTSRPMQQENEGDETFIHKNKHPIFERKIKVVGNDSFLKQIFS